MIEFETGTGGRYFLDLMMPDVVGRLAERGVEARYEVVGQVGERSCRIRLSPRYLAVAVRNACRRLVPILVAKNTYAGASTAAVVARLQHEIDQVLGG